MTLHTGSEAGVIMCSSSRCCLEERTVERIVAIEDMAVDELTKLAQAEQKPADELSWSAYTGQAHQTGWT